MAAISGVPRALMRWLAIQVDETKQGGAIATLDGVRAIACLTVMAYHIDLITANSHVWPAEQVPLLGAVLLSGSSGVTLFFVLSGFLLFLPFARAMLFDRSWPGVGLFYLRRALRIMPAYYVSLFLLVVLSQPRYLQPRRWGELALFVLFLQDSSPTTLHAINGPYWTLAVEWQFYLWLPLLAWGIGMVARRVPRAWRARAVVICLLALAVWGMLTRLFGWYFLAEHPHATVLVPRSALNVVLWLTVGTTGKYMEDFAVGMFVCVVYLVARAPSGESAARLTRLLRRLTPLLWSVGLLLLLFMAMRLFTHYHHYAWPLIGYAFAFNGMPDEFGFALGYGCCVLAVLFGRPGVTRVFAWAPLRAVGIISYSLYIWHLPLLVAFMVNVVPTLQGLAPAAIYLSYWVWAIVVVIPFAALMYLLVERPGMRLSDQLRARMQARHAQRHAQRGAPAMPESVGQAREPSGRAW